MKTSQRNTRNPGCFRWLVSIISNSFCPRPTARPQMPGRTRTGHSSSSQPVRAFASLENFRSRCFFITVVCPWLDGRHVVFGAYLSRASVDLLTDASDSGEVTEESMKLVKTIEAEGTQSGK